jgi:indolepyruvate ferredoxin oxidoreductase
MQESTMPDGSVEVRSLDDRYISGICEPAAPIYITGTQALVRLLLAQAAADRAAGLKTAGFVSGYRGSPLGAVDQELWRAANHLQAAGIRFQPGINEDLAATAVMGTQKVESDPTRKLQGVFALWYGKGPGVDRSGDVLKHANAYGSSPHGGVLVIAGDDHGCVSSSMSHQSDQAMIAWGMPVIHPATIADYEPFGLWGFAASRISGAYIGFKAISETVEGAASIPASPIPCFTPITPDPGPDGLHWRWPDLPGMQIERRLHFKLAAVEKFARANPLDHLIAPVENPRLLIAAVGKAFSDMMEALRVGGIDPARLAASGVALVKIGLVYPLSPLLADLAQTAAQVLVIEEKAPVVENLLKQHLFNLSPRPQIFGKQGPSPLPADAELRPSRVADALAAVLTPLGLILHIPPAWQTTPDHPPENLPIRKPYFCSGCPHNMSTTVPEGSRAQAGIGCHFMAGWMDRETSGIVQMGGEGVDWLGQAPFVATPHVFQNLGDGTFFHSGLLAIRQSIAAKSNITYKLLFNDAVAMTGGQPVDGTMSVAQITHIAAAEAISRVAVVTDDPAKYGRHPPFAPATTLHHRDHLDTVQRELRDIPGTTLLIYDQVCATEARRRRKRGTAPAIQKRVVINDLVCEGCGDCQAKSNCLSIVPIETELGRKRAIEQSSCNTDLSCLKGFCPSFVTIEGGTPRRSTGAAIAPDLVLARAAALPPPHTSLADRPHEILVAGIGGTGIVTVGALICMAAHLSGHAASVLDFTGFAQKGGQVLSHVRLARSHDMLHQVRIDRGRADAMLAADLVVAVGPEALATLDPTHTTIIANARETQTGTTLRDPNARIDTALLEDLLRRRSASFASINAHALAEKLLGDPITANILLLGMAWQSGLIPLSLASLNHAIELNNVAVAANKLAFAWGRLAAADANFVAQYSTPQHHKTLDETIAHRAAFLSAYQNRRYAARYLDRVATVRSLDSEPLTTAVARNLFKLMAYKDEYEVARLYTRTDFVAGLRAGFDGKPKLRFHLAPPLLARRGKMTFGEWIVPLFALLARLKFLRGTWLDPFGHTTERRAERRLLADYESMLDGLNEKHLPIAIELASLPEKIRGFGHVKLAAIEGATKQREALQEKLSADCAE